MKVSSEEEEQNKAVGVHIVLVLSWNNAVKIHLVLVSSNNAVKTDVTPVCCSTGGRIEFVTFFWELDNTG